MADITGYIADFFAGVGEGLEKIQKTLERNVIKISLAPAKKARIKEIKEHAKNDLHDSLLGTQNSLKEVSKNLDASMKGEYSTKVVETIDSKSQEYPDALK